MLAWRAAVATHIPDSGDKVLRESAPRPVVLIATPPIHRFLLSPSATRRPLASPSFLFTGSFRSSVESSRVETSQRTRDEDRDETKEIVTERNRGADEKSERVEWKFGRATLTKKPEEERASV